MSRGQVFTDVGCIGERSRDAPLSLRAGLGLDKFVHDGWQFRDKSGRRIYKVDSQNVHGTRILLEVFLCQELRAFPSKPCIEFVTSLPVRAQYEGILAPRTIVRIGRCVRWCIRILRLVRMLI